MAYEENRVRVKNYGSITYGDPRLVAVPGVHGQPRMLHRSAAPLLAEMSRAAEADVGVPILLASGWRRHRWESREQYEATVIRRFGSVREGRKWLAFNSPHETGLAIDIGSGGLWPTKATVDKQRRTELHDWLVVNAHRFGCTPYKVEPWHWEFNVGREAWE